MSKKLKYTTTRAVIDGRVFHKVTMADGWVINLVESDYKLFRKDARAWLIKNDFTIPSHL